MKRTQIRLRTLCLLTGSSFYTMRRACEQGRLEGAFFDPITWSWIIPCPVRLAQKPPAHEH